MQNLLFLLAVSACLLSATLASGQCDTWVNSPNQDDATDAHVLYVAEMQNQNYDAAYPLWKRVFELAPAADGQMDVHFTDGATILKSFFEKETDAAKKKGYAEQAMGLFDQAVQCLESGAIRVPNMTAEKRTGFIRGRQAFDMFYTYRTPYVEVEKVLYEALQKSGMDAEYIIFSPYAYVMVNLFSEKALPAERIREVHARLNEIGDYQVAKNGPYRDYYQQAIDAMNATIEPIELYIYDCAYFKEKFKPEFESNPEDFERMKIMIATLKKQGCPEDDAFLADLEGRYKGYADSVNAARQAEFEANNPGYVARKLYEEGKYREAIRKYEEALEKEEDQEKKAEYLLGIASIQYRKLNEYGKARTNAREAAQLKGNWGAPYMLIGDMYANSSRSCGSDKDGWGQSLAVLAAIEKYRYARAIDSEVAADANKKISLYNDSKPSSENGFLRSLSEGQKVKVGCWIGETVTLEYR